MKANDNELLSFFYSGKKHGPYGGVGGYYFDAQPPNSDCYLGWISGNSSMTSQTNSMSLLA